MNICGISVALVRQLPLLVIVITYLVYHNFSYSYRLVLILVN